ncbi:MAG: hypothetical protein V8Q43_02850 [Christensenellaceae bacterium]
MRHGDGRYTKQIGILAVGVGLAIFLWIIPCWAWLLLAGTVCILIGIHLYRSC